MGSLCRVCDEDVIARMNRELDNPYNIEKHNGNGLHKVCRLADKYESKGVPEKEAFYKALSDVKNGTGYELK